MSLTSAKFGNTYPFRSTQYPQPLKEQKAWNSTMSSFRVSRTAGRKRSSSSLRNSRGKLSVLKEDLAQIQSKIADLALVTKDISLYLNFLKEQLLEKQIPNIETNTKQRIKALQQQVCITTRSNKLKFEMLSETSVALGRNSHEISKKLQIIDERLSLAESMLGYSKNRI